MQGKRSALVLYSGGCRVCRATARWLSRRGVAVCPFRDARAEEWLEDMDMEQRTERWWLVVEDSGAPWYRAGFGDTAQSWIRYAGCGRGAATELMAVLWPNAARVLRWLRCTAAVEWLDRRIKGWRPIIAKWTADGPAPVELGEWDRERSMV